MPLFTSLITWKYIFWLKTKFELKSYWAKFRGTCQQQFYQNRYSGNDQIKFWSQINLHLVCADYNEALFIENIEYNLWIFNELVVNEFFAINSKLTIHGMYVRCISINIRITADTTTIFYVKCQWFVNLIKIKT